MAVFHDLAEVLTFDISKAYLEYLGNRGQRIKNEVEAAACKQLASALKPFDFSEEYAKLAEEYAQGKTVESRIVHAADGLDILLQVLSLRRRGYPKATLSGLWNMTIRKLASSKLDSARKILSSIRSDANRLR
jgi:5'-deoxynucleotidase YfbR-like HD superfamily hydrolase